MSVAAATPTTGSAPPTVCPPGDKSITHRALLLAALAEGEFVTDLRQPA